MIHFKHLKNSKMFTGNQKSLMQVCKWIPFSPLLLPTLVLSVSSSESEPLFGDHGSNTSSGKEGQISDSSYVPEKHEEMNYRETVRSVWVF